jgi:phage-related protein
MESKQPDGEEVTPKPTVFVSSSLKDLRRMPRRVQRVFGLAILTAQYGGKAPGAKPLKGFGGAGVLEVVEDHDTDTYRAVYTVRFAGVVYVLHVFQKKSRSGVATPKAEIDIITERLKAAQADYAQRQARQKEK